jgi:pimeloyl-ACP methyl ester carboxylesterase
VQRKFLYFILYHVIYIYQYRVGVLYGWSAGRRTGDSSTIYLAEHTCLVPDLKVQTAPILVIHGDADRILPYEMTAKLLPAAIHDCKLVTLQGAPHGIPWTHAEEINKELLGFLESK